LILLVSWFKFHNKNVDSLIELKADIIQVANLNDFKEVLIKEFDDVLKNEISHA